MKISSACLLSAIALLVLHIPAALCSPWWSIVGEPNVFDPSNRKIPIHLQCKSFAKILTEEQMRMCEYHQRLLSTTAIGTLQALNQCQKTFVDRPWNCSVFNSSTHYLGKFIDNCTRETSFLNAITSAGIAREVARKCKEQHLDACVCDFSVESSNNPKDESSTIIGGCGDNSEYGVETARQFTDDTNSGSDCCSLAALHNNKVGRELVKETTIECICHGLSGSCSTKTCFKKVPDIDEIGMKLEKQYDIAKPVKVINNELKPVGNRVPPLQDTELAYCEFSPNFCNRDLKNGIYGTTGRRCYPDVTNHSSCGSLCCGRGAIARIVKIPEDRNKCCKFIWCCQLDCSRCGYIDETQYFCS